MRSTWAPGGTARFGMGRGSLSCNRSGEGKSRMNGIEGEVVDCTAALLGRLFWTMACGQASSF